LGDFKGPLQERFEEFHRLNPAVLDAITRIATQLKGRGFQRAGMKLIFERLRWLYALQTSGEEYKLNNNYTAFYARLVMHLHPTLEGFFKLRKQRIEYDPCSTDDQ
jgi:hypothetical protein